ncbi:hypothetical protein [Spirosoma sp. KUDC1026]|uniref:hypothetical protein n=1 Tax=Spirosoma sp. KUDC1026 TaxID=2745947 RepID=UPI00159B8D0A|nr:hypothetical protein [Spirosoma sp. KUDC1026]QKZ14392.1 hypothetical protein HU175_17855 [Spirosoma sp. KUDC1026]
MREPANQSTYENEVYFVARLILRDDAYRNCQPSPRWTELSEETQAAYLLLARQRIDTWNAATPVRR